MLVVLVMLLLDHQLVLLLLLVPLTCHHLMCDFAQAICSRAPPKPLWWPSPR